MLLIPDTSLPDRTAPGARRCEPRRRTGAPADRAAPWPPAGCRRPGAQQIVRRTVEIQRGAVCYPRNVFPEIPPFSA